MLQVFIHPGPGKTGSSSIQNAMISQETELLSEGVLVPSLYRSPSGDFHKLSELIKSTSFPSEENVESLKTAIDSIIKQAIFYNAKAVVISSDFLTNITAKEAYLVSEIFSLYEVAVKIVIYKRNLYKLAVSTLQQQIQNGKHINNFYAYRPFTYFNMVKAYSDAFGSDNIIYRDYLFDDDRSWSVVADFYDAVLNVKINSEASAWVNKSLDANSLVLMNYFNYFLKYPTPPGHAKIAETLRWTILNIDDPDKKKPTLSEDEISSLTEVFSYDEDQFKNFLPHLSPYDGGRLLKVPSSVIGESFNERICKVPARESLDILFSTLGSYMADTNLISQLDHDSIT